MLQDIWAAHFLSLLCQWTPLYCEAEVTLSVVPAVMVDVVDYEMIGGVEDLAVHFDAFAVFFSNGVVVLRCSFRKPGILAQARIVFGIDNSE